MAFRLSQPLHAFALMLLVPLAAGSAEAADTVLYGPVPAPEAPAPLFDISLTVDGVTDYRFRGISQTDRNPAIQATVEATYSLFYAGAFFSNVDFGTPDPDVETTVFAGIRPEFAGFAFDLGVIGYLYPNASDLNFLEIQGAATYDFDVLALTGSAYYAPDFGNSGFEGLYLEAAAAVPLPYDFALSGAIGRQFFESGFGTDDYLTWNVGLSYTLDERVTFDVRYVDTDLNESLFCTGPVHCGSTVVASVSVGTSLSELRGRFSR